MECLNTFIDQNTPGLVGRLKRLVEFPTVNPPGQDYDGITSYLTRELGLGDKVRFFDPRPLAEIAAVMAQADLGVVPKRADSFGNEAYSTKIMEFMSLGVPMVVSSTKIDRYYFNDSVVRFFESGNSEALADAIIEVLQNDPLRRRMIADALKYAEENSWQRCQSVYFDLVDALIESRPVPPSRPRNPAAITVPPVVRETVPVVVD